MTDEEELRDAIYRCFTEARDAGLTYEDEAVTDFVLRALIAWRGYAAIKC